MSDINLLTQRKLGFFSEERLLLISRVSAVSLVIIVLSLSILFFFLSKDPSILQQNADKSRTLAQLTLLHDKTAKYLIVVDRMGKIQLLEKRRMNLDKPIGVLVRQVPPGAIIANFLLDKNAFSLSASSSDLSLLGDVVNSMSNLVTSKSILKDITVQGIVSDELNQRYVLTITGELL